MKNSNGFGKFEVLTMIAILLIIFGLLSSIILGGTSSKKLDTMKNSAVSFSKTVSTNINSFHNLENVYLGEAIDEKIIKKIKNPTGSGYCSESESIVQIIEGDPYVTLRCGDYLIEKTNFAGVSINDIDVYKVSKWNTMQSGDDDEERTLYNCKEKGKEIFDEYYEDLYFVYLINKKYNTDYYEARAVHGECEVVSKSFYRTKEKVK